MSIVLCGFPLKYGFIIVQVKIPAPNLVCMRKYIQPHSVFIGRDIVKAKDNDSEANN